MYLCIVIDQNISLAMAKQVYETEPIKIIKGYLQKLVSVNASKRRMTVDLALGLIGAYMLQKFGKRTIDWKSMDEYLRFLRKDCFKGKNKSIVGNSSFSDCVSFICNHLSSLPFEQKKGTLKSFELKVINGIDDNGCLSFNDKTFSAYATQQIIDGVPAHNYLLKDTATEDSIIDDVIDNKKPVDNNLDTNEDGTENIITKADVVANEDNTNEQEITTPENPVLLATNNGARQRNGCTDNSPFIQLYDKLIEANSEYRRYAKFIWQWFLTLTEYEEIKTCLANNKLPNPSNWNYKTTRLLSLYIGEFYKREYENNVTPFTQLGNNTPNANFKNYSKICEWLNIEPYKKDNQAHLHTLYVNGGFPVHYIHSKLNNAQSNLFIDGLSKLLNAEDEVDILEGEEELGKVNNTALRESYQKGTGHSIFEYIQAIMANNQTWDNSDNESPEYRGFIDKIKEANKKAAERKKFKLFYSLWTYIHESNLVEFSLQPQIRFNPEEDGNRHYAISKQRLANWGITSPPAQFSLRLGDKKMRFTKCCKGDFISWDMADHIDLNRLDRNLTTDDLLHSDFSIVFDRLNGETTPIRNDFNLPFKNGFLQFYTDDDPSMASWNSFKGGHLFLWSGVLFDKTRYHLLPPASSLSINEDFEWVTFFDCIALKDTRNDKIHTIFNSKGRIYAKPSEESLNRSNIDNPYLLPSCLLDGMAECTIGEERSYAYIVKSSNLRFDVFRVANDERVNSNPIVEYKSAQEYLNLSSPWIKYQSGNIERGLYVFRVYNARYSTEVSCLVLPDNAKIEFYNKNKPYMIRFIGFANVSSETILSSERDKSAFRIYNNNADSFNFTIGDNNGSISLQTYHPKPQIHVYLFYEEIDIKKQPILIAYADDIEVKYIISADKCGSKHLFEFNGLYKRLFDTLTVTVTGNKYQLLTQRLKINIEEQDDLEVRVYTQEMNGTQDAENKAIKLMLLDLSDNSVKEITGTDTIDQARLIVKETKHDGLLFQSLKNNDYTDVYYAPKFIPKSGERLVGDAKTNERRSRLDLYADKEKFASDYAFQQFEIACEHRIYFAVFDSLLSMCWNAKKKDFLDTNKKPFKKNVLTFLNGYLKYTTDKSVEPSVAGLKRLAREFLFDWNNIKDDIENSDSRQMKELYQEIINN